MATRRPNVPRAQFTSGAKNAPSTQHDPPAAGHDEPAAAPKKSTTAAPGSAPHRTEGAGSAARGAHEGVIRREEPVHEPVPARRFSGRLLVLAIVMAVLTMLLTPNVHTFLLQRAEISSLEADIASQQSQESAYQQELARWDDPAYIKQQARDRVSMLMPGETGYWVYGADGISSDSHTVAKGSANSAAPASQQPWLDGLWDSIKKSASTEVAPPAKTSPAAK
jgi:cell division protein FtsB